MSGTTAEAEAGVPVRLAAVYLPADLPRQGRMAFWDPDGDPLPAAATEELTVVRPHGAAGVRRRQVPALTLTLAEALPLLVRARRDPAAHPATACWGAATTLTRRSAPSTRMASLALSPTSA
ncbi:ATP-dependent helicase, partial [Streptomyces hyaluromycini]